MSTVGYGDQYPITNPGRVLGTVIIVVGVGIFGTLTGYLANLFLSPSAKEKAPPTDLEAKLQELKALTAQQQSAIDELEGLIDRKSVTTTRTRADAASAWRPIPTAGAGRT